MEIEFDYVKFKNINSFGNKVTSFKFKKGLNNISGLNGRGKSTIIDAISFNLFGTPYRKVKIADLINRTNEKNLWTESQFKISNKVYRIERGLKPNILRIFENGKELELLSSKSLIQEDIDKILGINYFMFKQLICLAVNYNKPFLTMAQYEKRNLTDSIFNIDVLSVMQKEVKKTQALHKTQSQINFKQISLMENNISSLKRQLTELKNAIANFEKDKSNEMSLIKVEISKYELQIKTIEEDISFGEDALSKLTKTDTKEIVKEIKDLSNELAVVKYKIKDKHEFLTLIEDNESCPVCKTVLDKSDSHGHLKTARDEIEALEQSLSEIKSKKTELENKLKNIESDNDKIVKINSAIEKHVLKKQMFESELKKLNSRYTTVENKTQTLDISVTQKELDEIIPKYIKLYNEQSDLNKQIKNNDIVLDILSDTGIKSHFFKKLIPILNSKINTYLEVFDLPIFMLFDEEMNETISTRTHTSVPYMGFSEGEKKRIDMAIQFSFFDTARTISNWQSNIIFFDELLDSGLDLDGMTNIISILKKNVKESKNLCTYLISHKLQEDTIYDNKISVDKIGNFSKIIDESIDC